MPANSPFGLPQSECGEMLPMSPLEAACYYYANGYAPIPIPYRRKSPIVQGWSTLTLDAESLPIHFNGFRQNIGLLTGRRSCVFVADLDSSETQAVGPRLLPATGHKDGREGIAPSHFWYSLDPAEQAKFRKVQYDDPLRPKDGARLVELLADGQQVVVWPSTHPSGAAYRQLPDGKPPLVTYAEITAALRNVAIASLVMRYYPAAGLRHDAALRWAGFLLNCGIEPDTVRAIFEAAAIGAGDEEIADRLSACDTTIELHRKGEEHTGGPALIALLGQPTGEALVRTIKAWMGGLRNQPRSTQHAGEPSPDEDAAPPEPELGPVEPRTLAEVRETFRRWLYLPDDRVVLFTLGTIAANILPGDPVWGMVVGGSSAGKTEPLSACAGLPNVHLVATIASEGALLSGSARRERAKDASGGLLRKVGDFGTLMLKDFTSILSMHRDARAAVLAALREIYDGSWTRHVGMDGGRELHWSGKLGILAACTTAIDSAHAVTGLLGERFIYCRVPEYDRLAQGERALANLSHAATMRRELNVVVRGLFAALDLNAPIPDLTREETARFVALANLATLCRTGVERDGRTREVELIPDAEGPARLASALARLYNGLRWIGVEQGEAWRLIVSCAFDSMPKIRRTAFDVLACLPAGDVLPTAVIATRLGYPTQTTARALQDLAVHGVVNRQSGSGNKGDLWAISDAVRTSLAACSPEMSPEHGEGIYRGFVPRADPLQCSASPDISGEQSVFSSSERETVCWQCKSPLSGEGDDVCSVCGWLRCVCGACKDGCLYAHGEMSV